MISNRQKVATFGDTHCHKLFHNPIALIEDEAASPSQGIRRPSAQDHPGTLQAALDALARANCRLEEERRERQRLESEIADVVEREQRRLGQELHDGLGQQLTGIVYQLSTLQQKLGAVAPDLAKSAQRIGTLIQDSVEQTRKLAKGFYPVTLERDGLMPAVLELAHHTQQAFGVRCAVRAGGVRRGNLPIPLTIQLFRIAQEAVHNAVKHAQAKHVIIRLAGAEGNIALRIEDDGVGLPPDIESSNGMGLRIMQHRAQSIRGTLEFRNREAGGAMISCVVPADAWLSHHRQTKVESRRMLSQTQSAVATRIG